MPGQAARRWKIIAAAMGRKWGRSSCRGHAAPGPLIEERCEGAGGARKTSPTVCSKRTKTRDDRRCDQPCLPSPTLLHKLAQTTVTSGANVGCEAALHTSTADIASRQCNEQ